MRHIRNIAKPFDATYRTTFSNLLVSGCSFTFNNSNQHACSWPYYLRDLCGFREVYDCSQSGAGSNHIFNSIVNEIESNASINNQNTIVIIAWSGLTRTDVIASHDITKSWHFMSNYRFDENYSTLSIFNSVDGNSQLEKLCKLYKTIVDADAQILESAIKIIALKNYLQNKKFNHVFVQYQDLKAELDCLNLQVKPKTIDCFDNITPIGNHATELEPCGHPTPNSYLNWTRECLLPHLVNNYPTFFQKM
jgi:hypothetical protein